MESKLYKTIDIIFKTLCIFVVIVMISYWLYKFSKDEDVCLVDYKPLKTALDIPFPEASLCFQRPLLEEKLNAYGVNISSYEQYLKGEVSNEKLRNIPFKDVSIDINDFFLHALVVWKNGKYNVAKDVKPYSTFNGYKSGRFMKCYAVKTTGVDFDDVKYLTLVYNINLYQNHFSESSGGVVVRLHQPNQFLATDDAQYLSSSMNTSNGVSLGILITSLEVLKRRQKNSEPCVAYWNDFDETYKRQHLSEFSCTPPYLSQPKDFPQCFNQTQMNKSVYEVFRIRSKDSYYPPCVGMSKIDYDFFNNFPKQEGLLQITIGYPEQVKIITQSQAVDVHTIIGNIGGYIGLFLGRV